MPSTSTWSCLFCHALLFLRRPQINAICFATDILKRSDKLLLLLPSALLILRNKCKNFACLRLEMHAFLSRLVVASDTAMLESVISTEAIFLPCHWLVGWPSRPYEAHFWAFWYEHHSPPAAAAAAAAAATALKTRPLFKRLLNCAVFYGHQLCPQECLLLLSSAECATLLSVTQPYGNVNDSFSIALIINLAKFFKRNLLHGLARWLAGEAWLVGVSHNLIRDMRKGLLRIKQLSARSTCALFAIVRTGQTKDFAGIKKSVLRGRKKWLISKHFFREVPSCSWLSKSFRHRYPQYAQPLLLLKTLSYRVAGWWWRASVSFVNL